MDRPHHDHLGHHLDVLHVHARAVDLLHSAGIAGAGGGGILPGRAAVSFVLGTASLSGKGVGAVLPVAGHRPGAGKHAWREPPGAGRLSSTAGACMAVAIFRGRGAVDHRGRDRSVLPDRQAGGCALVVLRGALAADRHHGPGEAGGGGPQRFGLPAGADFAFHLDFVADLQPDGVGVFPDEFFHARHPQGRPGARACHHSGRAGECDICHGADARICRVAVRGFAVGHPLRGGGAHDAGDRAPLRPVQRAQIPHGSDVRANVAWTSAGGGGASHWPAG